MIRQHTLLPIILTIFLTSCEETESKIKNQQQYENGTSLDSLEVAILQFDTTQNWLFKDYGKPTNLTNDDVQKIERFLNMCVEEYNSNMERKFKEINDKNREIKLAKKNFTIDLTRYKRQYVVFLNSKDEKEVWVNCFCESGGKDWKKNLIFMEDGGNCFFNLKINLTTGQYYELMVNGDA